MFDYKDIGAVWTRTSASRVILRPQADPGRKNQARFAQQEPEADPVTRNRERS
jgi:hypothetical protein